MQRCTSPAVYSGTRAHLHQIAGSSGARDNCAYAGGCFVREPCHIFGGPAASLARLFCGNVKIRGAPLDLAACLPLMTGMGMCITWPYSARASAAILALRLGNSVARGGQATCHFCATGEACREHGEAQAQAAYGDGGRAWPCHACGKKRTCLHPRSLCHARWQTGPGIV